MHGVDSNWYGSQGEIISTADGFSHLLNSPLAQDEVPNASFGKPQIYVARSVIDFETCYSAIGSIDTSSRTQQQQEIPTVIGKQTQQAIDHKTTPTEVDDTPNVVLTEEQMRRMEASSSPVSAKIEKVRATCEFCGKSFSHLGDANKHRRSHTGERPYTCSTCFRGFPHASNLRRHERSHSSNPRPFLCPNCTRGFSRKDKLAQHVARRCCNPADAVAFTTR